MAHFNVIARLVEMGLTITRQSNNLLATPRARLTDEARALIREHKAALLALCSPTPPTMPTGVVDWLHPCPICQGVIFNEGVRGGYFCPVCQPMKSEDIKRLVSIGYF